MGKNKPYKAATINRIIVTTLVAVIVVFALTIVFFLNFTATNSIERAKAADVNDVTQMTLLLKDNFDFMSRMLKLTQESLAALDFRSESANAGESANHILSAMLDLNPDVHCAWFIFKKGIYYDDKLYVREYVQQDGVINESFSLNAVEISNNPDNALWYFEPLATGEIYFTIAEPYKYSGNDEFVYAATISMPISANGEIIGVCGIDILYSEIIDLLYGANKRQNSDIMLLSQDMTILHAPDSSLINKNLADFPLDYKDDIREAMEKGEIYSKEVFSPLVNKRVFLYLHPISIGLGAYQQSLYMRIGTPVSELYAEGRSITFVIIISSIMCVLLIGIIIFVNANRIAEPVRDLARMAKQVASGDYKADIFEISERNVKSTSEIITLQLAFNEMLHALQENLRNVEMRVEERTRDLNKLNNYVKLLVENASSVSILTDQNLNILYCSDRYIDLMCANDLSEIIGKPLNEVHQGFSDAEYLERCKNRMNCILSEEKWLCEDETITWPNGENRVYRISYSRVNGDEDNFEGVVVIFRDLTDVRLEEAERRINDMLYSTATACFVWDETGRITAYNKECANIFGLPRDLLPGEFNDLYFSIEPEFQPDGRKTETVRMELLHQALENGFSQISGQLAKADGTPIFVDVNVTRIARMSDYRLIAYHHDTTELVTKELEVKEAERRIRLMLDATPLCCHFFGENFELIDCNKAAMNLFGIQDKQTYLNSFYTLMPEYQPDGAVSVEKAKEYLNEAFTKGHLFFEWVHQTYKGELIPSEVTLECVKYGESDIVLSYVRDLRDVKAKEQQMRESAEREREAEIQKEAAQAANEAKSQFLANMSHEIRTPMNAVLGMSELLLQEKLNERQDRYAKDIKTSAIALLDIINDILDVSKIQSGKLSLVPVHYDFHTLIDNIGSMAQFLVEDKNISFSLIMEGQIPVCLYGDDVRLRQVLVNLLGNAVKFTSEGYVQLTVGCTDTTVKMTVSDTGIGIPAENIPTLFDAFEQIDVLKNRNTTGTGLGLTITKSIVDLMGGRISVESVYDHGTSFHVEIPMILGDESQIQIIDEKSVAVYAPGAKVLVVDDNKTNLNVACGLMRICGICAETAESGEQAIDMVSQNQYDLIFMDHRMPGMSGAETTKAMRQLGIDVPIVALTASAIEGTKDILLESGMNDCLWKPIKKVDMMRILHEWLPGEKQITPPAETDACNENKDDEEYKEFWRKIEQVEGLSVPIGLERVDGQRSVYRKTLKLMVHEIDKSVRNMPVFLAAGDMDNFHIEVHSIKGALANIGAMALSEKALGLETASGKGDMDFCISDMPDLIKELNKLNRRLGESFALIKQNDETAELPEEAPSIFQRMTEAFAEEDLALIDKELENLDMLKLNGALKEEIEQIKDLVMMMDYDGAIEQIEQLLYNNKNRSLS